MSKVFDWSTAAGSNNDAPPDGWPENMLPGKVNDCAREMMAAVACWFADQTGALVTTGTGAAYALATNSGYDAVTDIPNVVFRMHLANTGAATLAVDGLTAKPLVKFGGTALSAGDLAINQLISIAYNPNLDRFEIIGPVGLASIGAAFLLGANNLSDVDDDGDAFDNIKQGATDTYPGVVEFATEAETQDRSDTGVAVTPAGLATFARIATGTYTGDGGTTHAITGIGFQPKYVKIMQSTSETSVDVYETTDVIIDDDPSAATMMHVGFDANGLHLMIDNAIISLDADGFTVDDDNLDSHPNKNGTNYNYLCIG